MERLDIVFRSVTCSSDLDCQIWDQKQEFFTVYIFSFKLKLDRTGGGVVRVCVYSACMISKNLGNFEKV